MPDPIGLTVDLPAWDVDHDLFGIFGSSALSTPDTGTELILNSGSQPIAVGLYSLDGTGTGNISFDALSGTYPPIESLASASYVVIAYAESSESGDPTEWSPDEPDPTQFPFLMIESSRTTDDGHTLDPIPVGAYAGEIIHEATHDLPFIIAGTPANRLWLQSYSNIPIHIAYLAVRLTWLNRSITGEMGPPRTRFSE